MYSPLFCDIIVVQKGFFIEERANEKENVDKKCNLF